MALDLSTADSKSIPIDDNSPRLRSNLQRQIRTFLRNRTAILGLVLVLAALALSIGAPLLSAHDPLEQAARFRLQGPNAEHLMGYDTFGRDIFARVLYAGRVSLLVGVCSVGLGLIAGSLLGVIAGYFGGKIEQGIMRFVDVLMAFPSLLLGLTVLAVLGSGVDKMIFAIGLMLSPSFTRVVHSATLSLKEKEFIHAARSIGVSNRQIIQRHVLPNVISEIVVLGSLLTASAIRVEANLSFIGLGVSPPTPTWGNMIRDGAPFLTNAPWLSVFPGIAILLTVLGFNLLGDGLRDVLDPKMQE